MGFPILFQRLKFYTFFLLILNFGKLTFSLSDDGLSLLSLKSAIDSPNDSVFGNWNENDSTPCNWSGISCMNVTGFDEPRVVGITLPGKSIKGYIPSELGALSFLRSLNLHGNSFYGSIPDQLLNASSLHSIFLHGNNLSGSLPVSLCNLPRLQNLDISRNALSGSLPSFFKKCKQLQSLILGGNGFSGEIMEGIFVELVNLEVMDLSANKFSGVIPEDIGELKSLSGTLNLSFNHFTGKIPKSLGDLGLTVSFDFRNNNLSGEIPQSGSFVNQGPTAFLNNPMLCGFPLQKQCETGFVGTNGHGVQGGSVSDHSSEQKGLKVGTIILISMANAVGVSLIGLLIVYVYWKRKYSAEEKLGGNEKSSLSLFSCINGTQNDDLSEEESEKGSRGISGEMSGGEGNLVAIDKGFSCELDELLRASAYVLGKSSLGIVYKVVLGNGMPVAVRRLGEGGEQRCKEFVAEIQAIGKVRHPNIVKLRAYYWARDEKLLISDYICNGSLAYALRGKNGILSWSTRLNIAKGTARGLAYLHECSPRKFVHGNIKPSNILLDTEFHPLISDFGLNKLITITSTNCPSSGDLMGGALSYLKPAHQEKVQNYRAPEARAPGTRPTQKWDVYSFGVVLLELLTGKSMDRLVQTTLTSSMEIPDLVKWARNGLNEERGYMEIMDPALVQELHGKKEVEAVFRIAFLCTEDDPDIRPRMKNVLENLEKIET